MRGNCASRAKAQAALDALSFTDTDTSGVLSDTETDVDAMVQQADATRLARVEEMSGGQRTPAAAIDHRGDRAQVAVADRATAANHNQDEPRADPALARSAIDGFRFADLYVDPPPPREPEPQPEP